MTAGAQATFSVTASGGKTPYTYQWQYRQPSSGTWTNVASNGTSATYTLTTAARHNGYQYRCIVKDSSSPVKTVTSSTVTLTVNSATPLSITKQPTSQTVTAGAQATFSVTASGGKAPYTYQWQYRQPSSGTWTNVASNGTSATYTLTTAARHNGYQYRCIVKDSSSPVKTVTSNTVTLTVVTPISITRHPKDTVVPAGTQVSFSVTAKGSGLTYQWQYLKPGAGAWVAVSAASGKTPEYTLTAQERHNGYRYRCVVTAADGQSATSNVAYLAVYNTAIPNGVSMPERDPYFGRYLPVIVLTEEESLMNE